MSNPSFKITFTLGPEDVAYFRRLFRQARKAAGREDEGKILRSAKRLLREVRHGRKTPKFVLEAMTTLDHLLELIEDVDYRPPRAVRNRILGALAYFGNPGDLIPDHIPVFGFLDDALMVKLVEGEFAFEIAAYHKFVKYRAGAEQRPWTDAAKSRLPQRLEAQRKKLRAEVDRKLQRQAGHRGLFS
ncbi:MAG: YkvA family protein [Myxococcota bacterium]|nr:YkvA family protein [Myxococcota bacterium]